MNLSLITGFNMPAHGGNTSLAVVDSPNAQVSLRSMMPGEFPPPGDAELDRMIACDGPAAMNLLGLDRRDTSRQCMIIPYSPTINDHLDALIRPFAQDASHPVNELGLIVHADSRRVVALHLHRESDGRVSFRLFDPESNATARQKFREKLCRLLRRHGIDREWPFLGAWPGYGKRQKANHGLHAVLAMRDMLAGQAEFTVSLLEAHEWRDRLTLMREARAGHGNTADPADPADPLAQMIARRTADGGKKARELAEKCSAISIVLQYAEPSRKMVRFQGLNSRFYRHIVPYAMGQVSMADYPGRRTCLMQGHLLAANQNAVGRLMKQATLRTAAPDPARFIASLNAGSLKPFLGWLVTEKSVPNTIVEEFECATSLNAQYDAYLLDANNPAMAEKMRLNEKLGNLIGDTFLMPGVGWQLNVDRDHALIDIGKDETLAVVDLLNDVPPLPADVKQKVRALLDEGVADRILTEGHRLRALANLKPVAAHFKRASMTIDVYALPGNKAERETEFVHVECTSIRSEYLEPRKIYMGENVLLDEAKGVRLFDKLKTDIARHFEKMGWEINLGESFRPWRDHDRPKTHFNDYTSLFLSIVVAYSNQRALMLRPNATDTQKIHARLNLEAIARQMYQLAKDVIPFVDGNTFGNLIQFLDRTVSVVTFSRFSQELMKAMKKLTRTEVLGDDELQKFQDILVAMFVNIVGKILGQAARRTSCG